MQLKIGTWNVHVRSMLAMEKLENVKNEMKRHDLNILGFNEVRWKDAGDFETDDVRVIFAGGKESQKGVV